VLDADIIFNMVGSDGKLIGEAFFYDYSKTLLSQQSARTMLCWITI